MTQRNGFSRMIIEPASNGYIVEVEYEESEEKLVFQSLRLAMREVKKIMRLEDSVGVDED